MTTLGERVGGPKRVVGGPFGSNLTSADYTPKGVPVIRGSNMEQNGRWIGGEFAFVSAQKAASDLRSNIARRGDIIVTQRGTMGQVSIVPDDAAADQFVISQSQMAISVDASCASRDFVYYYLRSPQFAEYLTQSIIQTGVPHINLGILRQAPAEWPAPDVQEVIAGQLKTLDDKIELNRRMNVTLETMAQAIFRDWFVDFGPVRRKMEGATDPVVIMGGLMPDPARAAELAELFPGTFTGDLPDRWSSSTLGDHFRLERGLSYKGAFLHEDGLPMINLGCFLGGGSFSYGRTKGYKGEYKTRHLLRSGTLILANTDMTQNRIILGSPHIVQEGLCGEEVLFSHHVYAARPRFESSSAWARFFYFHLLQPEFRARAEGFATGTTVLALPKDAVEGLEFPVPSEELNAAFLSQVEPLLDRVTANELEIRTLAETRDYLLPRLMSGEVRVGDDQSEAAA